MCIDSIHGIIYMFGGWDGKDELSDLWAYDVKSKQWNCIAADTSLVGGPSARSCHKLSINENLGQIYALGRYVDPKTAKEQNLKGDFYRFDIASSTWFLLSADTEKDGGTADSVEFRAMARLCARPLPGKGHGPGASV